MLKHQLTNVCPKTIQSDEERLLHPNFELSCSLLICSQEIIHRLLWRLFQCPQFS
jgi:hypothetical protein